MCTRRLAALMLLSAGVLFAQLRSAEDLLKSADAAEAWFPFLATHASWVVRITVVVIVLGAASTVLALSAKPWIKYLIAAVAAAISIMAGIKAQVLHADKESFEAVLVEARELVAEIREKHQLLKATQSAAEGALEAADEKSFEEDFTRLKQRFEELRKRARVLSVPLSAPPSVKRSQGFWRPWPSVVHAEESQQRVLAARSTPETYAAVGVGVCSSTFSAREYARYEARRLIAREFRPQGSPDELVLVMAGIEGAAKDYRNQVTRDPKTGMIVHRAEVRLEKDYRLPNWPSTRPVVRWEGVGTIPPGSVQGQVEVQSKPGGRNEGDFKFLIDFTRTANQVNLKLREIQVFDDSSAGSTQWFFAVQIGGRRVFLVPTHRFSDGGRPDKCQPTEAEGLNGSASAITGTAVAIEVLGFKPKDL